MKNLIIVGKITASLSFIIGTIILAFYMYLDNSEDLLILGFYFVIIITIVNILLFAILIIAASLNIVYRKRLLKTCGLLLLNIPIAIFYMHLVLSIEFPSKG